METYDQKNGLSNVKHGGITGPLAMEGWNQWETEHIIPVHPENKLDREDFFFVLNILFWKSSKHTKLGLNLKLNFEASLKNLSNGKMGALGGSVGWVDNSSFGLRSRSQGCEIKPYLWLHTKQEVCLRLSFSLSPYPPHTFSL